MDKNIAPIKQRILHFIENVGVTKESFYEKTGLSASNFKGPGLRSEIGGEGIGKILSSFSELNPIWLLTGKGDIFQDGRQLQAKAIVTLVGGIPLLPIHAMAGIFKGEVQVMEYEAEQYVVPAFKDADFLIPIKGSSMYPKYSSGDIVACKKLESWSFFQYGKVYVIYTSQGALVKRVKAGSDDAHILIVSDNDTRYPAFELHRQEIMGVALVMGVIRLE